MASETAGTGPSSVWDVYFGQPAAPAGSVNWEAYSHEELYQMLWQDADVADVSTIAAEWSEHRTALTNHAEVLREQRAALLAGWTGSGAEEAARRLGALADRVEKLAELALAGEQAAGQAAEALSRARAMMPPPPGDPAAPMTDAVTNWAGVTGAPAPTGGTPVWDPAKFAGFGVPTPPAPPPPPPPPAPSSDTGTAFGAVGGAGFSFYVGAGTTDMQKQQAVRAMQNYESSLTDSSRMIGEAQSTIPAAASMPPSSSTTQASAAGATTNGTPSWQSLVGSGDPATTARTGSVAKGVAAGAVAGVAGGGLNYANQLAQGLRSGAMAMQSSQAAAARMAAEMAARSGAMTGMVPPGAGAGRGSSDEEHENQLPTIDHGLFPAAEPGSEAVIGLPPEEYR
ncbi:hypothetical protein [Amycolatopsis albispora]|uniref:PPE family domain-containing protein n=1 Tax=Amycolatopsis albispora TaxID=1804986 RepID=A0A344KZX3_9PSEU|nr:hypothetical protein [Amycolatopsis albispora]AXB41347.1 hypothetical protein A4R43_01435 [Amycolatopsis albispora]